MVSLTGIARRFFTYSFRVYNRALRITREGWFFLGFTFAVGIAAINTGNNLMYLVLAMMLGVMVVSGILSENALRRIRVERRVPAEMWAGRPFEVQYVLSNPKRLLPSYSLRLQERGVESVAEPFVLKLGSGERTFARGQFMASRRGVLEFSQARVLTQFPFGLFEKTKLVDLKDRALVFPAPIYGDGDGKGSDERGFDEVGTIKGDGVGLFGLREYHDGDNPRRIHWKTSARAGKLMVKETLASDLPMIALVLDTTGYRPLRDEEALEDAISRCAGLVLQFIKKNYMVRLITGAGEVPYGSGPVQLRNILTHLALFEPRAGAGAATLLRPLEAHIKVRGWRDNK